MPERTHPDTVPVFPTAAAGVETLHVTTRRYGPDLVVLSVYGEVDLSNAWLLEAELARHDDVPRLVVDMSNVQFCAVAGARLLHTAATSSIATGHQLEVIDNAAIARLLTVTGFAADVPRRDPDLDYEKAERNLREYAHRVAIAAGSGPESTMVELEPEPVIYIALSTPSATHPDRDTALMWTACHGWMVVLDGGSGPDEHDEADILGYFGSELLAGPPAVAEFAAEILSGRSPAPAGPPPNIDAAALFVRLCGLRATGECGAALPSPPSRPLWSV